MWVQPACRLERVGVWVSAGAYPKVSVVNARRTNIPGSVGRSAAARRRGKCPPQPSPTAPPGSTKPQAEPLRAVPPDRGGTGTGRRLTPLVPFAHANVSSASSHTQRPHSRLISTCAATALTTYSGAGSRS